MINKIYISLAFLCLFLLYSCQKIEVINEVVFDYNQMPKIIISSDQKKIVEEYEANFNDPYIDHSLNNPPKNYLKDWMHNNLKIIGSENQFTINIIDASIKKSEIENKNSKKYQEKTIFLYEISFLVEYILYNDSNSILVNTIVEAKRTTTSSKFISLMESEKIVDNLILDCLIDFSKKSDELIKFYFDGYIL